MKYFSLCRVALGALVACLLAMSSTGCSRSDSESTNPDPDKVKQEADRLRQQNQKMFEK
jgi:hypothetical protein